MAETYDAGDPEKVKTRRSKAQLAAEELDAHTRAVLDTYAGRAVLWSIVERCGVYRAKAPGTEADMAEFLGRRNIGLSVIAQLLTVDENLYMKMHSEAQARERKAKD